MSPTASCEGCRNLDVFDEYGCVRVANCMRFHRKLTEWHPDEPRPHIAPLRATCKEHIQPEEPPEAA